LKAVDKSVLPHSSTLLPFQGSELEWLRKGDPPHPVTRQ